jgi:hypothetical protein
MFIKHVIVRLWYFVLILRSGAGIAQWYSSGLRAGWSGGSSPGRGWEFFSSPPRPDRLWSPPSLLSNEYRGMKLTTHHLVTRSRMRGAISPFPNTPSWRGAQLKHRDKFTFYLYTPLWIWNEEWLKEAGTRPYIIQVYVTSNNRYHFKFRGNSEHKSLVICRSKVN